MRVTFDSNVWEKIVDARRASSDGQSFQAALPVVADALRQGAIEGFVAEGYFTIEAMTKTQRTDFLARQQVVAQTVDTVAHDGSTTTMVLAAGDESDRPPLPEKVRDVLPGAIKLGLRILPHVRFHQVAIPGDWYVGHTEDIAWRIADVSSAIETRGVGLTRLRQFGLHLGWKYSASGTMLYVPDVKLDSAEAAQVARLAAEWADGDAIACHVGFGNDIFCTQDRARNASKPSVMDEEHRRWLEERYNLRFMDLEQLAEAVRHE